MALMQMTVALVVVARAIRSAAFGRSRRRRRWNNLTVELRILVVDQGVRARHCSCHFVLFARACDFVTGCVLVKRFMLNLFLLTQTRKKNDP